jgi:hypothetical protein
MGRRKFLGGAAAGVAAGAATTVGVGKSQAQTKSDATKPDADSLYHSHEGGSPKPFAPALGSRAARQGDGDPVAREGSHRCSRSLVSSTKVSTAKAEYLRASITKLGISRRSAAIGSGAYPGGIGGFFGRPAGFPLWPLTKQPLLVRFATAA